MIRQAIRLHARVLIIDRRAAPQTGLDFRPNLPHIIPLSFSSIRRKPHEFKRLASLDADCVA